MLKSESKATEFCNLLSTYCLLDVIAHLEVTESSLLSPLHKKLEIDLPKNEEHAFLYIFTFIYTYNDQKALQTLEDWTLILQKFHHNFTVSKPNTTVDVPMTDLPTQQLHALFQLHSNINDEKSLVNLQLAATHIAFMLELKSGKNVSYYNLLFSNDLKILMNDFL